MCYIRQETIAFNSRENGIRIGAFKETNRSAERKLEATQDQLSNIVLFLFNTSIIIGIFNPQYK